MKGSALDFFFSERNHVLFLYIVKRFVQKNIVKFDKRRKEHNVFVTFMTFDCRTECSVQIMSFVVTISSRYYPHANSL